MTRNNLGVRWIQPLAEPYLRGFPFVVERGGDLRGYWFARSQEGRGRVQRARQPVKTKRSLFPGREETLGFFVGYLLGGENCAFLKSQPPECLVFAFVQPTGGALHERLVARSDGLVRHTFEYIRWLTHRPPRFEFYEAQLAAMVRHSSMREWPAERYEHFSRNFFIETLAWLVRSGLVRRFLNAPITARRTK